MTTRRHPITSSRIARTPRRPKRRRRRRPNAAAELRRILRYQRLSGEALRKAGIPIALEPAAVFTALAPGS